MVKKYALLLILFIGVLVGSCKKDRQKPLHESSWTINGTKYNIENTIWSGNSSQLQYILQDKDGNMLRLGFLAEPTAGASYDLVSSYQEITS